MSLLATTDDCLLALLRPRLTAAAWAALEGARRAARVGEEPRGVAHCFAALDRQVGHGSLPATTPPLAGGTDSIPVAGWSLATAARASLLLAVARGPGRGLEAAVALYDRGEIGERIACLRALPLLEANDTGLVAIADGCRSNVLPLFDAATVNPYASRWLDDDAFAHAVLKRATLGLPLASVVRLDERGSPELARMLRSLIREREISARPWPAEAAAVAARLEAKG